MLSKAGLILALGWAGISTIMFGLQKACAAEERAIANPHPQYLVVHKTDTGGASNCWFQQQPDSINQDGIDEILNAVGTRGTENRKLAFSYSLSYLNNSGENMVRSIKNMLKLSEENDLPLFIHLDGVNWWNGRPDLWNWWDPNGPGYDPDNIYNVEWYGWEPENAVKIGWRNWGTQFRVPPQPNLASPAFLKEQEENLNELLPLIAHWYRNLPQDRKYLLGGVVLGWEVSPYVQFFYYPDGNSYIDGDPAGDPKTGIAKSIPLGYSAASSMGLRHSGRITGADIDAICSEYIGKITSIARKSGIPRDRLISHSIIFPGTERGGSHSGSASLTPNAIPGWSFYDMKPSAADRLLTRLDGTPWAAIEFQSWGLTPNLLESFFSYKNCRYINIFNWESVYSDKKALDAIRKVLARDPDFLATTAADLKAAVEGGEVRFSWTPGRGSKAEYLQISAKDSLTVSGLLQNADVLNRNVTGQVSCEVSLPPGIYYATLVSEDEKGRKIVSEVYRFSIAMA